jgi:hypothetical protein
MQLHDESEPDENQAAAHRSKHGARFEFAKEIFARVHQDTTKLLLPKNYNHDDSSYLLLL